MPSQVAITCVGDVGAEPISQQWYKLGPFVLYQKKKKRKNEERRRIKENEKKNEAQERRKNKDT